MNHSLLDLLLNGPEAKLSGCTDVNYSRLLLISCVIPKKKKISCVSSGTVTESLSWSGL